jgi:N-acetylmuramoyl-L-alanine amidase
MTWAVAGKTIVVDAGHGGEDPGKVGVGGHYEKDINLQVAIKLRSLLAQGGAGVAMTREVDKSLCEDGTGLTLRERKREDLKGRIAVANEYKANLYVAIHCNSFPKSTSSGAQVFFAPQVVGSLELAQSVQTSLQETLGNTRRVPKEDSTTYVMKETVIPTINVEIGFLSNPREEKLLLEAEYQNKVAWAIYRGIVQYLVEYSG